MDESESLLLWPKLLKKKNIQINPVLVIVMRLRILTIFICQSTQNLFFLKVSFDHKNKLFSAANIVVFKLYFRNFTNFK